MISCVTINETYFFREQKYFKLLDEVLLPFYRETGKNPMIWSAASSVGTEAISIALLVNKHFPETHNAKNILATDVDFVALDNLNKNRYSYRYLKEDGKIFHELIHNNSRVECDEIMIDKKVIGRIFTQKFNLVKDDYKNINFKPDIVFLCNLLTYMDSNKKKFIIDNIVNKMNPGGILILSSSDTAFIENDLLLLQQRNNAFYFCKKIASD